MKKLICVILVAIILSSCLLQLTACGGGGAEGDNELTVWAGGQWTGTDLQNLKEFINNYNKNNTLGIKVNVVAKSDMETSLVAAVRTNKAPDILIWDRFNTPTHSDTGALLDVTSYIERDSVDVSVFNEDAMSEMYYNGKCYGLPLDLDVWGVYVNTDMVDAYNASHSQEPIVLNDNWTWDEMYSIAQKLTVFDAEGKMTIAGYSGHVMHQHYFKYFCSTSQSFLDEDGEPNFDTAQSKKILEYFKKIGGKNNGIWENGLCEKSNFTSLQLAMIDQSLYYTDYIQRYNSTMHYKFMPQPRYEATGSETAGVNGGMLGGFGIAFPKPAEKYLTDEFYAKFEKAWAFAKDWLLSESMQSEWSATTGTLPALKALYSSDSVIKDPTLVRAASFVDDYSIRPQIPGYLAFQTQVIDTNIKAYTEGNGSASELEATVQALISGYHDYTD